MDVGTLNRWDLSAGRARRRDPRPDRRGVPARSRSSRTTAARSPDATASRTASGEIGIIASVTQPFCGDCTRARSAADGRLRDVPVRRDREPIFATPLRSGATDAELARDRRSASGAARSDRYSELRAEAGSPAVRARSKCIKWVGEHVGMRRFDDKVVLISGAASGIGRATAERLAAEGAALLCVDVQAKGLAETGWRAERDRCDGVLARRRSRGSRRASRDGRRVHEALREARRAVQRRRHPPHGRHPRARARRTGTA